MRIYFALPVVGLVLLFAGCKKKDNDLTENKTRLLTFTITGNFIPKDLAMILFLNDPSGNVIADTLVRQNGTYTLYAKEGSTPPQRFSVTIVTFEFYVHNFMVTMNTFLGIPRSDWTIHGVRADTAGHMMVTLKNLPAFSGPILYSTAGYSNLTFATDHRTIMMYKSPDDLYVRLNTLQGPSYKWLPGITTGNVYEADMSVTDASDLINIQFPFTAQYFEASVKGYLPSDEHSGIPYMVEELLGDGNSTNSVSVSYPPGKFSRYHTELYLLDSWTSNTSWNYQVDGNIPDAFRKINAEIQSVSPSPGQVSFQATGIFNVTNANWTFSASNNQLFNWNIYGTDSLRTIRLPQLSPLFKNTFPTLGIDSLGLEKVRLMDFAGISSYEALIQQLFNGNPPKQMSEMEMSSINQKP